MKTIHVSDVQLSGRSIIGYYVSDSLGLATLTQASYNWGFRYFLQRQAYYTNLKFLDTTPTRAMKKALAAGRTLFMCDTWDEAVEYALACKQVGGPQAVLDLRRSSREPQLRCAGCGGVVISRLCSCGTRNPESCWINQTSSNTV